MDPEKAARANLMYQSILLAHIQAVVELHHAPNLEQMMASYESAFDIHRARPSRSLVPEHMQEDVLRLLSAESVVIREILAKCYDTDKQRMLGNFEGRPDLLGKMPVYTDFLPLKPKS